ncbi:aspartate kinase [Sphingobacteriaceae bacterium WQ 2009]|uniref:Aspartokinase n=1 Tax=Rhinopithecimicrobium faecis TaxID=2820698 RepID=A0A8T4H9J2_9SPHI|nr:aspartate kinase [Sphingobacteriaceae bacterium WQ 2009]
MQVFKFGGASVKNAEAIKNVKEIVEYYQHESLLIVISAMGKTTNKLEAIAKSYVSQDGQAFELLEEVKQAHFEVIAGLFGEEEVPLYDEVSNLFVEVEWILEEEPVDEFPYIFDQIVSIGELVSTKIIASYILSQGIPCRWIDARNYIATDNYYQEAGVDWERSKKAILKDLPSILTHELIVTQGFIGSTSENFSTTLGREGSDYSAAIFASCLDAQAVTIWKDVPGVLNADPKWFAETALIPELSYTDAIELTYYGATVIHPKTIKPLQNKGINLYVKSFLNYKEPGTVIRSTKQTLPIPSFIFKMNQVYINIMPRDFSFILEDNLSHIFNVFFKHRIKTNMMRNSAISFSVSVDDTGENIHQLLADLAQRFEIITHKNLELITIRYYNQETIDRVLVDKQVIAELKDSYTCQLLVNQIS